MTQSTYFNQVKNVLKVLQGYTKGIRFVAILTMLLTVGIGSAWGATDVILWNGSNPSYEASTTEKTSTDGAIKWVNSAGNNYSNPTRIYSDNTLTISVANTNTTQITKIVAVCTSENYASAFGGISVDVTGGGTASRSVSGSTTTITITGKATKVAMKMSAQSRVSKLTVTYETSGGGGDPDPCTTPTVAWNTQPANGEVGGSMTASVTTNYSNGLTYSSSNQTVATVTNAGVINYISAGTTTITATVTGDGTTFCEGPVSVQQEITVTAPAGGGGGEGECSWKETAIGNIQSTDIVVITMTKDGTTWALTNDNGTSEAPDASIVIVSGSTLTGTIADNLKWNITNNAGSLTIYPNGDTSKWLYCTSTNNGVRVGTNDNKTFTIDNTSGYLKNDATSRYLGVYNSQDWRCYTNTTGNTANQTLKFYVYKCDGGGGDDPEPDPDPVDPEVTFSDGEYTVGGAALDLSTLLTTNSTGAVTYSVETDGGTGATIEGSTFTATAAGTCTIQASIAATATHNVATATANITVTVPATVEGTWILVTDAASLKAGDRIVIAAAESDFALSTTQNSNNRGQAAVTKNGNNITFTAATQILTLEAGTVDNTLAFNTGSGYLYAASSSNNYLKTQTTNDENSSWSISIAEGIATVKANGTNTRNWLRYNSTNSIFSCYGSGQGDVVIYKEAIPTLTVDQTSLAFGNVTANSNKEMTFTLTGSALTANAALALSGTNEEMFSVSPASVTPTAGSINQIVTVTYKPTAIGNHTATLTISSTDAESKTVALSGTGVAQAANYTVKHYQQNILDDNYTLIETETPSGEVNVSVTPAVKTYEGFTAPSPKTVTIAANGSTIVEYQYTRNSYTLAWEIDGGTITVEGTPAGQVKYGATLTAPTVTKDGFQFKGWNPSVPATMPAENVSYTAQWTQIYTITWNVNGDTELISPTTFAEGDAWDMPTTDYDCSGKGFVGWTTNPIIAAQDEAPDPLYTNASQFPNATATYYAVFAENTGGGGSGGYEKLTAALDDYSGEYLIVYEEGPVAFNGGLTTLDATRNNISVTITEGVIASNATTDAAKFTFAKVDGGYSILSASGEYIGREATTNGLNTTSTYAAGYLNTITYNSINGKGGTSLRYNNASDQKRFRYFASGQQAIALYKKQGGGGSYSGYTTSCGAPAPTYTIIYDINGGTGTIPTQASLTEGATFELALSEGFSKEGYVFAGWNDGTTTYDAGAEYTMSATNVTFTAQWIEKSQASITLSELGVTSTIDTYSVGDQYTLPNTSSQSCAGKQLVGWSTVEVAETDTKPTENYYELGEQVTLVATQTFFAVFATVGDTEEMHVAGGDMYSLPTGWINHGTGIYSSHGIKFDNQGDYIKSPDLGNSYTELTLKLKAGHNGGSGSVLTFYAYKEDGSTLFIEDEITITPASIIPNDAYTSQTTLHEVNISASSPIRYILIWMTKDFKNLGMEYCEIFAETSNITGYTTSCIPTYSITYDFAGGTGSHCSNTSVPQGDTYTICDEAPTKEGYTFQGWSDGINTYQPNNSFTPTSDITLTAQWQVNTYIVTWNNNGVTTPIEYNHGETLELPAPPASCDGVKEFVGWTEQSGYYHATTAPTDLFKTTTATVTADKTYYAVFATPPGAGGGGGGSETTTTLDFTAQGYANAAAISNLTVNGVTTTFAKGSNENNAPKYYDSGSAIRAYGGNTITLSANQITSVTFTFGESDGSNEITADCGSWDSPTWTGDATNEVVFTIGGSSGNRRIKSIAVACTSGDGSGSYSDYTTTCQQVESIEVQNPQTEFYLTDDFTIGEGKVMATLSDGITKVDVTSLATFSGYNMEVVGTYTVTVTYMGTTATYNINVKALDNAWVLTWNVSGKTNTGLGPRSVTKGNAIGTLPTPEVPDACEGKTFMGWTTSNIVPSDGIGIEYITSATKPTDNTTYYAVFATINNFSIQKPIDQITSGTNVVIVAVSSMDANGTAGKAISSRATDDTHNLQGDDVTIVDEHINTPHSTCIWTVEKVDGKYRFSQNGKYLNGVIDGTYSNLKYLETTDSWTLTEAASGMTMTYNMESTNASGEYIEWFKEKFTIHEEVNNNGAFDMQFFVTANADGEADITDYTTGCAEYTITYYGFTGGYSTSSTSDGTIVLPVNSYITIPDCGDVVKDPTTLGREFLDVWMTKPHGGHSFKPGDTFVLTQDTTLYAQWKLETTGDVITLPTDVEDLAGTDIYVYGGTTLNIQPGTTTINTLVLRGGIQSDGSYKMPSIWVPEGATLVRNNNKIYLDLAINAKNWYPFAVPFATTNNSSIDYLDPVLNAASTYGTHFDIKTYDGARRAEVGEDRTNNWVHLNRHTVDAPVKLQPGVGYLITAMTYPDKDTATIRIPMTVPNTWFQNGEQTVVGTAVRNTIAVEAHKGAAATEHQRHAGWNFVANPYLTNFAGSNVVNDGDLAYINGAIDIEGGYTYGGEDVPYVTVPAYDFSYYEQYKLSDVKLSPEWSFFVQVGTSGTMNFTTEGRQHAPATIRANSANAKPSFDANIVIINENANEADHTGLVINDRYTTAYEIGGDLEKMFGSANRTALYTLSNNIRLAYNALAMEDATQPIPLGYRAEKAGEYTIQLTNPNEIVDVESIVIKDNYNNVTTNLLISDYTFYTEQVQDDERFVIYIVPKQNTTTNLMDMVDKTETKKVIFNNHLYIIHNGYIYDGVGKTIKNK